MKRSIETENEIARRSLLLGLGGAAIAMAASQGVAAPVDASVMRRRLGARDISFVDLTHKLDKHFNSLNGRARIAFEAMDVPPRTGMFMNRLTLVEHTGTHLDSPRHFDKDGRTVGEIPLSDLIVPLAIVDIRAKAAANPNAALAPEDILAWERRHGRLPRGCCVALWADWGLPERRANTPGGASRGSPGFTPQIADLLIKERDVRAVAVEAGSIDIGANTPAYPFHKVWLHGDRWALENVTNLDKAPPAGALLIAGAAPIEDATGIPVRLVAMF